MVAVVSFGLLMVVASVAGTDGTSAGDFVEPVTAGLLSVGCAVVAVVTVTLLSDR